MDDGIEALYITQHPPKSRLLTAFLIVLIAGYALLSHYSSSRPDAKALGAILSIGPVFLIAIVLLWRWAPAWIAAISTALAAAMLFRYRLLLENNFEWADLVQQCGAYALIALSFARSLTSGRVPLCTQLATELQGTLEPAELAYNRSATRAWAVFYSSIAAAIAVLFFAVSQQLWSLFTNFVTFGLIVAACVADYAIRRAVLPHRPQGGLFSALRRSLIG